jgi:beta-carotene hydroxylase
MKVSRLIRYPIDIISVVIVLSVLSLQLLALSRNWPWYMVVPILLLVRDVNLIEHNHMHLPIFRSKALNALLGWLCHLSNGVPLDSYKLHHVANHHRYNNRFDATGRDWSSLFGFRGTHFPDRPIGKAYYMASFPVLAHGECLLWFLRSPTSRPAKGFVVSMTIVIPTIGFLVWLNPVGFVTFFVLPWIVMLFGMANNNYDHHQGCKMTNPYDSANNFLTFYYTKLSFNVGYHVAHHLKPNLHWSLLPRYHNAIAAEQNRFDINQHTSQSSAA